MINALVNFFRPEYMPNGHAYLWKNQILWLPALSDTIIALAYLAITITALRLVSKLTTVQQKDNVKKTPQTKKSLNLFAAFMGLCGINQLINILSAWYNFTDISVITTPIAAIFAIMAVYRVYQTVPELVNTFSSSSIKNFAQAIEIEKQKTSEAIYLLTEQTDKFNNLITHLPLGAHIVSLNQHDEMILEDSNPAADSILGINNKALYGLTYQEAFPSAEDAELPGLVALAARDGVSSEREIIHYEDKNISGVFSAIFFQLMPGTAIALFQDVSDKHKAKAINETEKYINRALNSSFTGIYIYNIQDEINEFTNHAYTRMLGYTLEEINAMDKEGFSGFFHPDDAEIMAKHINSILNCKDTNEVFDIEYRFKHKQGHWVWCLAKDSVFEFDKHGKVKSCIGSFLDITDRKIAEEKLAQVLRKLNLVVDGSNDGHWYWFDPGQDVLEWSDYFFEMLGYQPQEFTPTYSYFKNHMIHPDDLERTALTLKEAIETKKPYLAEHRIADKHNVYKWYRAKGMPYYNNEGEYIGMAGSLSDINETKELQNELIRSNQELEQFSFIASHDLKEPVRTIRTFVDYLMQDVKNDNQTRMAEDASYITSACDRMTNLIDALLQLSRAGVSKLNMKVCNLNSIINQVTSSLKTQINETNAIITITDELPNVIGDPLQLELVFQNLIQNAIKFSGKDDTPEIEIGFNYKGMSHTVEIYVRDHGIGIPSHKLNEIFGVFKKLHPADEYSGTGIGLAIVEKIIQRSKGQIHVESIQGQGSTFTISLPNKFVR